LNKADFQDKQHQKHAISLRHSFAYRGEQYSGGDALADARTKANQQQPKDDNLEEAAATNISDEEE
jgi:hypothetical protein